MDLYADSDFAGLFGFKQGSDRNSARSRTGYIIYLGECPLSWASKLQTEIALSTAEAEYICLSMGMRELIPLRALVKEVSDAMGFTVGKSTVQCRAFEDNQACIAMTQRSQLTPRTRHITMKWHWFLDQIGEAKGIIMEYIDSHQQVDILTKGLDLKIFAPLRNCIMGWTLHDPPPPAKKAMDGSTATRFDPRGVLNNSTVYEVGTGTNDTEPAPLSDSKIGSICPSTQATTNG